MDVDREKMEKLAPLLDALNQYRPLLDTFHAESDRGAILVASSILENALEQLFRSVLVDEVADALKLFKAEGPLATFSARINMSRAFGLIPEVIARQLNLVRHIRNTCAHSPETVTFATPEVRDRTEAMWNVDPLVPAVLKVAGGPPLVRYRFLVNASFSSTS
jgi:DNA-binding MltR family transcriptional regulator